MKRTLKDFLEKELVFEHLRTIYRYFMKTGGYDRSDMVDALATYLQSPEGKEVLASDLDEEQIELLYVLRHVGGIAPRAWLFRELAARSQRSADDWKRTLWSLRKRHLAFLIGSDIAYLPEGISDLLGKQILGTPPRMRKDVIPGASSVRQSAHGFVVALLNYIHQAPPRVMAEEERIWKRDLEAMGDFFHTYLLESGAGENSIGLVRGRINRLVELFHKMGFLEKRGKRLYLDSSNWSDWVARPEVERQGIFLSFLKDHYENIPLTLEALVDWKAASWVPQDRLTEAVRYRTLRSAFHMLRVRPQTEVKTKSPGRRWVSACVYLLADLGLVHTGSDGNGEPVACPTDTATQAWANLHAGRSSRRKSREASGAKAYAQPNFELLIPEECAPRLHRTIGAIAEIRSLDRFWTYVLNPNSVARGVEEGWTAEQTLSELGELVDGVLPENVRDAVGLWAKTAWWVDQNGSGPSLRAEPSVFESIATLPGSEEIWDRNEESYSLKVERSEAERWLEENGVRVVEDDRETPNGLEEPPGEIYARAVDAWKRRTGHGGQGTPTGSYWDDVVPVEPLPESGRPD